MVLPAGCLPIFGRVLLDRKSESPSFPGIGAVVTNDGCITLSQQRGGNAKGLCYVGKIGSKHHRLRRGTVLVLQTGCSRSVGL